MHKTVNKVQKDAVFPKSWVTRVSQTCVGDSESDPGVDIFSWCGNDTPVDIVITIPEWSRRYREGSCCLIVCNGASVIQPVPWRFHNNLAQIIKPPFAPVLCVVSELQVVFASYSDGSAIRSHDLCWSREISWIHSVFHKPQETENWCCKGGRKISQIIWSIQVKIKAFDIVILPLKVYIYIHIYTLKKKYCYHKIKEEIYLMFSWWEADITLWNVEAKGKMVPLNISFGKVVQLWFVWHWLLVMFIYLCLWLHCEAVWCVV